MSNGKRGAPEGNTNGAKGRRWLGAIEWALEHYHDEGSLDQIVKSNKALYEIAMKIVEGAREGKKDEWQEIGNRLDGKSPQVIQGDGEDGELNIRIMTVYVPADNGKSSG